jgi:hypothetical protein
VNQFEAERRCQIIEHLVFDSRHLLGLKKGGLITIGTEAATVGKDNRAPANGSAAIGALGIFIAATLAIFAAGVAIKTEKRAANRLPADSADLDIFRAITANILAADADKVFVGFAADIAFGHYLHTAPADVNVSFGIARILVRNQSPTNSASRQFAGAYSANSLIIGKRQAWRWFAADIASLIFFQTVGAVNIAIIEFNILSGNRQTA